MLKNSVSLKIKGAGTSYLIARQEGVWVSVRVGMDFADILGGWGKFVHALQGGTASR